MDGTLKNMLDSGKNFIRDTKIPGQKKQKIEKPKADKSLERPLEKDPHKRFVNSVIKDNLNKKEMIEHILGFISQAEAEL
jgi:hypothetical protein